MTTPTDPARRAPADIDIGRLANAAWDGWYDAPEAERPKTELERLSRKWSAAASAVLSGLAAQGFVVVGREDLDELFRHYGRFRDHPSYLRVKAILAAQDEP